MFRATSVNSTVVVWHLSGQYLGSIRLITTVEFSTMATRNLWFITQYNSYYPQLLLLLNVKWPPLSTKCRGCKSLTTAIVKCRGTDFSDHRYRQMSGYKSSTTALSRCRGTSGKPPLISGYRMINDHRYQPNVGGVNTHTPYQKITRWSVTDEEETQ